MKRHTACQLDDISDGTMQAVDLGGRGVLLVRHGQRVLAVRDVCPHQGGEDCLRVFSRELGYPMRWEITV